MLNSDSVAKMTKLLAFIILVLAAVTVNAQNQATNRNQFVGQAFDEIVVSSDLSVRRKSKENRQGKQLLTNVPSGTTSPPGKSTALASKLVLSDGSSVTPERRKRRGVDPSGNVPRELKLGMMEYLLRSQQL
ncbi:PREDICTED: uncharacterized protein LOC105360558 [Ceratosolen solmsi marchali]|uniref:Uncharacterized protein LOC105360558 n=1 Tax=Ceratosolen solmsi marchali TaxID=326594 RepID=A0AAJ6YCY7_9HYME|nr:PREDICTED: uncharacterized protein LOC105360558 [Ceratosolen solmsi marchali]